MKLYLYLIIIMCAAAFTSCEGEKLSAVNTTSKNVERIMESDEVEAVIDDNLDIAQDITQETITRVNVPAKGFHIIVSSHPTRKLAENDVTNLSNQGYSNAQILENGKRFRVSIENFPERSSAIERMKTLGSQFNRDDFWVVQH